MSKNNQDVFVYEVVADAITYTTDVSRAVDEAVDKVVAGGDGANTIICIRKGSAEEMAERVVANLRISPMVEMSEWTRDDFIYCQKMIHGVCQDAALRLMAEADADVKAILMGGAD